MKITEHGSYLMQLTRFATNCYFVREDDGLTLVDCSWPGSANAIVRAAAAVEAPIRRIVLTHAHHDHTGSLEPLCRRLADVKLLVGRRESRLLAGDLERVPGEPNGGLRRSIYRARAVQPDAMLDPGSRVGALEVVDAKGHTPGQIGLVDTRDGTLICGDAYLTVGKPFVCTEPVLRFPVPALLGLWHGPTAISSARALRRLEPARLATGHGRVIEAPGLMMDAALTRVG
jgi:glyoxylase-like metal-dependent hydrolase (beta-lactamase superfamily II)